MAVVLLTDGQQRKTLSAARSLGKAGHQVIVAEVTRFATARFSRYVALGLVCPDPKRDRNAFESWLVETIARHQVDCLLPMDDASTESAVGLGDRLGAAVLLPSVAALTRAGDKATTVALAEGLGIRVPRTATHPDQALAGHLGWPVVVKTRQGSGSRGVFRASDAKSLRALLERLRDRDPAPVLQECLPQGRKFDVCLLYDQRGQAVATFVQEELRGYPLWGGPSTLQESVSRPDLVALAQRLLAPLGWRGPVEVEFMEDPRTGEPVLMEINPRFWASLDLAVACGVDFPLQTAQLALGGRTEPVAAYPLGRRCRWLLPGDLLHFLANPKRLEMQPAFWATLDARTHDDILSWDDPLPTFGFLLAVVRYALDLRMWRMVLR